MFIAAAIPALTYIWGILVVIFTFGFMIFVHELGHFLMAKRVGIKVHEFALGMGPRLFRIKEDKLFEKLNKICMMLGMGDEKFKHTDGGEETEYCLRAVPFGGFVSMEGEDEPGDLEDPANFNNKSVWDRAKVIVAGCTMNYITGITLMLIVGFIFGVATSKIPASVATLTPDYPMAQAGIKPGDKVLSIDGTQIGDFEQLRQIVSEKKDGDMVKLEIQRKDSENFTVDVPIKYNEEYKVGMLGFSPPTNKLLGFRFIKVPPMDVIRYTAEKTFILTISPAIIVQKLMSKEMTPKQISKGSAGPLGIGQMLFEVAQMGIAPILYMCALLSILIGAFNLIPFPALDGSRLFFLGLEAIRKKPLDPDKEGMIHQMGFIVLIILVLIVTWNDILRLVKHEGFFK